MGAATADSGFNDSEFDWDALHARPQVDHIPRSPNGMDHLAWAVVVLLTFCPALGFVIALFWWR